MDSATVLAMARSAGHECYALSFDYGQRHSAELDAARQLAAEAADNENLGWVLELDDLRRNSQ